MSPSINLIDWLETRAKTHPGDFPRDNVNYFERFKSANNYLNLEVHPNIEKLAILEDGGLLTDHGPDHIKTVISRASDLLGTPEGKISGYEVYILLLAIHFHDVGNIYGRKGHEQKIMEVMDKCKYFLGNDSIEMMVIRRIADAHGGEDKNKISKLTPDEPLNNKSVRMQRLAAILRFADELADDKNRANRFAIEMGKVPPSSEVFHRYALHLHSLKINSLGRTIELYFAFGEDVALTEYGKHDTKVFLLDEILMRSMKMHLECVYCMRFLRDIVQIEKINVRINVHDNEFKEPEPRKSIAYQLKENGYPEPLQGGIYKLCPELKDMSGVKLKKILKAKAKLKARQ